MSWKTLIEKFGDPGDATDPFDFQKNGEDVTIIAVPAQSSIPTITPTAPVASSQQAGVLQLPNIPSTKTVEVHQAPEVFKGELPHLAPEEHEAVIDWFDKASVDTNTPVEVRKYLIDIVMKLKTDSKKRIPTNEQPVQESLFRDALEKVGLAKKPIAPAPIKASEPTEEELFSQAYPTAPYIYEYEDPVTKTWRVFHKGTFTPSKPPAGSSGEGFVYPQRWGLDKFQMELGYMFPKESKLGKDNSIRYENKPGVKWRTIWKGQKLYDGIA